MSLIIQHKYFILGDNLLEKMGKVIFLNYFCGRKVMTNLDSIFESRDISMQTMFHLVKAMVFPVVMYECESWTVKKAEH